jgi:hypothetical protein
MLVAALAASTAMLVSALAMASPAHADDAWTQQGIDIDGEAAGDLLGYSVATSADGATVAIGAPFNDGNGGNSGQVRVYTWDGSTWTQQGGDIDGEAAGDQLGYSVAMSGDGATVAIGAPFNDGNGGNSGQVRVYTWNGSTWIQRGGDIDGEAAGDFSGWSVALSADGTTVAIGAPNNDANGTNAGQVRVYTWDGSTWTQQGGDIDGEAAGDLLGYSVAMSGDGATVAIGAPFNDGSGGNSGQVRVYAWNGSTWTQRGSDIDGEAGDESGSSVAISSDGTTVAIGAPYNSGNGFEAGQARIYIWSGSTWIQRGGDIDGEAAGDKSGKSVAMSADGATIAIGAPNNDTNGSNAGQVRVFTWLVAPTPVPLPTFPPGAPASVTAIAGHASAAVSWSAPADPGSYPVSTYQVTATPGGRACLTSTLTCEIGGLTNGTAYTFTVRALNGAGWGTPSDPSNSVTPQAPPKPSILISGTRDGSTIRVDGTTIDLTGTLTPWVRFPGQTSYIEGSARPAITDNAFTWSRKANKKSYVYFTHGDVKSNTLTIPAR